MLISTRSDQNELRNHDTMALWDVLSVTIIFIENGIDVVSSNHKGGWCLSLRASAHSKCIIQFFFPINSK